MDSFLRKFLDKAEESRYFIVTLVIMIFLLLFPYTQQSNIEEFGVSLLLTFSLIVAGFSVYRIQIGGKLAIGLMILTLIIIFLFLTYRILIFQELERIFTAVTFGFVAVLIFADLATIKITGIRRDFIWGGIATYLLIGLTWGSIFDLVQLVTPGSFSSSATPSALQYPNFIYYSFYLLTTIGGVITPNTLQAQSLVMVEPLMGTLYIAILISRLVSLVYSRVGKK
jgi:hypothetical protein